MNTHSAVLIQENVVALNDYDMQLTLALIGDTADALLEKAAVDHDDNALDEAWEYIDLYNKMSQRTEPEMRSVPKPERRRHQGVIASGRATPRASRRF